MEIEGGLAGLSIGLLFWVMHRSLTSAWIKYRDTLNTEAQTQLTEMFVFVDLSRLWPHLIALACAVGLLLWVWSGNVALGMFIGVFLLFAPPPKRTTGRHPVARFVKQFSSSIGYG